MLRTQILAWILCGASVVVAAEPKLVHYPAIANSHDARSEYPIALLGLALQKAGVAASLRPSAAPLSKSRAIQMLKKGQGIDVVWTMTTQEREQTLLPIRIPIYRGLGSYRLLLVRADRQPQISALSQSSQLRQLKYAQVHDWVDSQILQDSKFSVLAVSHYDNLFQMLLKGRVDAIPRGVLEIEAEAAYWQAQGLVIEPKWLIHYPSAVYFFVDPRQPELAAAIEQGLQRALADGSFQRLFDKFFARHLANMQLPQRQLLSLPNRYLPLKTPLQQTELWYSLRSVQP